MPGSRERTNARKRARRLILAGDAGLVASYFGVTRGTVMRWRRTSIPEARIGYMLLHMAAKAPSPVKASRATRVTQRKTRIWTAEVRGKVKDDARALTTVDALGAALKRPLGYPKGATFQWVIYGVAVHTYDQTMVGHYKPIELRTKGKKLRTQVTIPSKASGRLDVALDGLLTRLTHLEPFFNVESVKVIVRKAKG